MKEFVSEIDGVGMVKSVTRKRRKRITMFVFVFVFDMKKVFLFSCRVSVT